ncbi:MAG TPA: hypothetical protein VNT55_22635, partial [Baekduia sp.]|nr:hypothetical protein [Baekduia sp.]
RSGTLLAIGDVGQSGYVYLFKVGKPDQVITFPAVGSYAFGSASVALGATSTSGLAIAYSALSGPCTISGTKVTLTGSGSCVVAADQAGSADYAAAPRVTQTITITKGAQTIAFPDTGAHAYGDAPVALAATATSGLPVAYGVTSGPCTVSGKNLTLTGSGTCVVAADQAGNADYDAAPRVTRTVAVAKAAQAIDFPDPGPHVLGDAPVALGATASSDLPVAYSVASGPCTVSGATLTLAGVGTCVVAADQPGDQDHAAAATVTRSVAITAPPAAPGEPTAPSSPSVFTPLTAPPAVDGTSGPDAPAAPISAGAAKPCAGLTAGQLLRCHALITYKAALAKCTKISTRSRSGAKRRSACVAKAKLAYHRALARAKCQSIKNVRSRATCVAKARKIKK